MHLDKPDIPTHFVMCMIDDGERALLLERHGFPSYRLAREYANTCAPAFEAFIVQRIDDNKGRSFGG